MLCVMLPAMICRLPFKMIFGLSFALFWSFWLFGTHIFSSCFFNSYYIAKLPLKVWMLHSPCLPVSYFFTYLFKISRKKFLQTHRFTSFSIYSFYFFILKSKIISLCMKIRINLLFTAFSCGKQTTFSYKAVIFYIFGRESYTLPQPYLQKWDIGYSFGTPTLRGGRRMLAHAGTVSLRLCNRDEICSANPALNSSCPTSA